MQEIPINNDTQQLQQAKFVSQYSLTRPSSSQGIPVAPTPQTQNERRSSQIAQASSAEITIREGSDNLRQKRQLKLKNQSRIHAQIARKGTI